MFISTNIDPEMADKLLSDPTPNQKTHSRSSVSYCNRSERFKLEKRNFQRQFAHIYSGRLTSMRSKLEKSAKKKWGKDVNLKKLFELETGTKCAVIGTLFKHMEIRPSILKEISEEHALVVPPPKSRYTSEEDKLILEDELQRISLVGDIDIDSLATGVLIAVFGVEPEDAKGKFHVEDYCFVDLPAQVDRPIMEEDRYIALVSGFDLGSDQDDMFSLQLMIDLLTGQLGGETDQGQFSKVVRVLLAGNLLNKSTQDREQHHKAKYLTKKTAAGSVAAMKSADELLTQLATCVDVDLMPGESDPANFVLPQQALHRCMFPSASRLSTLHCVSNPYHCEVGGVSFLGTSGQPVDDIYRYSNMDDRVDILAKTLKWGHLAPTAPDTLGCYPYDQDDPFIIEQCPQIYFAANQPKFQCDVMKGAEGQEIRLVCIPRFSSTKTFVLINLKSLQAEPIKLNCHLESAPGEQMDTS